MTKKLYERFSPDIDFSDVDHFVIGSGIGGLTVATWLAKAGKKVAIFERHYVPGGFTHSFKRKHGFQWDVGVHYVGNVGQNEGLLDLFNFLTDQKLEWESLGETYDVALIGDETYEFKAGIEQFKKQMISYFPEEGTAIEKYIKLILASNKRASAFFFEKVFEPWFSKMAGWLLRKRFDKFSQKTTYEVLKTITNNQRLIAVLCAQCGNYGLSPKYSSFAAHALVIGHFMEGGYYPKGGAEQICNKTLEVFNDLGGVLYINADVQEIITKKNKVIGLRIDDKEISCNSVISNVGVDNTFNSLLSEKNRKYCNFDLNQVQPASGHICLYVGLDKSSEALNLPKHNVWYYATDDTDAMINNAELAGAPNKFAYISFPSAKDPEWEHKNPGTATIQAMSAAKYEWFSLHEESPWRNRGDIYSAMKKQFETEMLERLYQLFPQIKGHVKIVEVSSPLSTRHFSNYKNGEIYGLAHTPNRFKLPFLRPKTRLKGLKLVGQDITLVGVSGAMFSGILCATTILKFRSWRIFKQIATLKKEVARN